MDRAGHHQHLITELEAERDRLGMTNNAFAEFLGLHPFAWSALRHGKRHPSEFVLMRILRRRPDLLHHAVALTESVA